jgi:periplasmic divalent cation tolerance protein
VASAATVRRRPEIASPKGSIINQLTADTEFVVVQTTLDDDEQARELAGRLVEERLAACVQCIPIHSTYRWQGKVESNQEILLVAKTRSTVAAELQSFIREHHPYELPELIITPIAGGLAEYLDWIRAET